MKLERQIPPIKKRITFEALFESCAAVLNKRPKIKKGRIKRMIDLRLKLVAYSILLTDSGIQEWIHPANAMRPKRIKGIFRNIRFYRLQPA
jgi:hypothetical protein